MTTSSPGRRANRKGKRGQTEAKNFLLSLGFVAVNAASHGVTGGRDVYCEDLPRVWVEVKYGYPLGSMDIHTQSLHDAWQQVAICAGWFVTTTEPTLAETAMSDDGTTTCRFAMRTRLVRCDADTVPVVLWKPPRRPWRLTWMDSCGLVTVTGADAIKAKLMEWKGGA